MNDSEIIKALECCMKAECQNCPMYIKENQSCMGIQIFDVVVLINRQKAEINRLNAEPQVMRNAAKVYTSEINCLREEIKNLETTLNLFVFPKNTEV